MAELSLAQSLTLAGLADCNNRGGFAVACDGSSRKVAHQLDAKGLADWKGFLWGSSFYSITPAGIAALESQ